MTDRADRISKKECPRQCRLQQRSVLDIAKAGAHGTVHPLSGSALLKSGFRFHW